MNDFKIMCRVEGGVTGTRTSQLKRNGEPVYFDTLAEAETEAKRLTVAMNRNLDKYAWQAVYTYWAEETASACPRR